MKDNYLLFLILEGWQVDNFFSNKHFVCGMSLKDLDEYTSVYYDAQDLGDDINHSDNYVKFVNAVIISEKEYDYLQNNKYRGYKGIRPLFKEDSEFYYNQTKNEMSKYNYDNFLIYNYKNYLLSHRGEVDSSLVKNVRLGIDIDGSINKDEMDRVFMAYYKKRGYKKMRDTYLELKRMGVIKSERRDSNADGYRSRKRVNK